MNIGIVTQWFDSGAGNVSKSYAQVLSGEHQIFIYARGGKTMKRDIRWDGQNITWAPPHIVSTGIHKKHFLGWAKRNKIEAVLFNEQRHWEGVILAKNIGLLTGAYVDYYTQDTVPFFKLYDFLICNTKRHYELFRDHPQCVLCPWGTDLELYKPKINIIKRPLTFITSAGWCGSYAKNQAWMDRRGIGQVLRAFNGINEDCKLIVYSQDELKNCPKEWIQIVEANEKIKFISGTFDPFPYNEGDVYVYPSRLDGIGLTLPEALSCGLPVITTSSPPMNEFVKHLENGLLVPVSKFLGRPDGYFWAESICDENALRDSMEIYLGNPKTLKAHSIRSRELAELELNWNQNAAFLKTWIGQIHKVNLDFSSLEHKCRSYDKMKSPSSIWQLLLIGYNLYFYLRAKLSYFKSDL